MAFRAPSRSSLLTRPPPPFYKNVNVIYCQKRIDLPAIPVVPFLCSGSCFGGILALPLRQLSILRIPLDLKKKKSVVGHLRTMELECELSCSRKSNLIDEAGW